jgi:hypothetical protein
MPSKNEARKNKKYFMKGLKVYISYTNIDTAEAIQSLHIKSQLTNCENKKYTPVLTQIEQ